MINALDPARMTAAERLDEAAAILACGLIRMRAPKSRKLSADQGESCLDFSAQESGHDPVETTTESAS